MLAPKIDKQNLSGTIIKHIKVPFTHRFKLCLNETLCGLHLKTIVIIMKSKPICFLTTAVILTTAPLQHNTAALCSAYNIKILTDEVIGRSGVCVLIEIIILQTAEYNLGQLFSVTIFIQTQSGSILMTDIRLLFVI